MLITRFLAAAIALVAGFAFLAPANAGSGSAPSVAATSAGTPALAGDFGKFNIKIKDSTTLRAFGNTIGWKRKTVLIQRAPKGTNRWTTISSARTDGTGAFATRLKAGADIPCTGRKFQVRALKKGTRSFKKDDQLWYCS